MTCPADTRLLLGWHDPSTTKSMGFGAMSAAHPSEAPAPGPEEPLWSTSEGHLMTLGPTGSGKGRSSILPALLSYEGPAIVIDPKGEACAVTARQRALLGPVVRLDPYRICTETPDSLNPFDLVSYAGMGVTEAALLLADLLAPPTFSKDPFWDVRAVSLLSALIEVVLTTGDVGDRHPGHLRTMLMADDLVYSLAVLLDTGRAPKGSYAYEEISQFLQLPERETRPSVQATVTQHTVLLGDPAVASGLSRTTFDLGAVRTGEPMTIYLVLPPSKLRSHARLLRLWVATLLRVLMARTVRPHVPTLFLLDETAQLGTMDDLVTAMTLLRGYGVRVWSFWQDLQQVQRLYPNDWQTMVSNAAALQVLGSHWVGRSGLAKLLDVVPEALAVSADRQLLVDADGTRTLARKADYLRDPTFRGRYDANPLFEGWDAPAVR